MDKGHSIVRSASVIVAATFASRVLGFIRDMVIAKFFGATSLSDAFFVAFRIPNLARDLFAEGAMSAALIPVLSEYRINNGEQETIKLVRIIFVFIFIFVGGLCVTGIIFAPFIVRIIAPGFLLDPFKFQITVTLTRIMFPFLLFVSFAALLMGSLNARKIFFIPTLASAWFNFAIIATILILYRFFKEPVIVAAIGVSVGGVVQFIWQIPVFVKGGYSLKPLFNLRHPALKKMGLLLLPATVGMGVNQLNIFISTMLASYMHVGSIAYLYYAMRLIQFPIGIFGVALSTAVLPTLSDHAAKNDIASIKVDLSFSLKLLFAITVPSMIGLMVLGKPIVHVLFQRGHFDYIATLNTTIALMYYSCGIWAIVGARMLTSAFYSMQDTKTPVKLTASALIINLFFSIMLIEPLGYGGLALANALAATVNFFMLLFYLYRKLHGFDLKGIIISFFKTMSASLVMGICGWVLINQIHWIENGHMLFKGSYLLVIMLLCSLIYFVTAYVFKSHEIKYIAGLIKKRL
ncbi:MAG: murein biosynthesis integral membrane protein MurJ [Nitrospirae bacterium]|nr:murein biosynthesis integral membrane protein MurJ [Nitrospirota bacterium]MBF0541624.1 murein biosynthesis integral membrane protein MurJ [Nitrospirota bacterium]